MEACILCSRYRRPHSSSASSPHPTLPFCALLLPPTPILYVVVVPCPALCALSPSFTRCHLLCAAELRVDGKVHTTEICAWTLHPKMHVLLSSACCRCPHPSSASSSAPRASGPKPTYGRPCASSTDCIFILEYVEPSILHNGCTFIWLIQSLPYLLCHMKILDTLNSQTP
jgi:hypothetical protein